MSVIQCYYRVLNNYSVGGVYTTEQTNGCRQHTLSVLFGSLSGAVIGRGSGTTFLTALQTMENGCAWVADYSKEAAVRVV
jgi:hypothetical protein